MALPRLGEADKVYDDGTGLLVITRRYKVPGQFSTVAELPSKVKLAYETPDEEHSDCLLATQRVQAREGTDAQESVLTRIFIEVPEDAATLVQIGNNLVTYSENGLKLVEQRFFGKRTHSLTGDVGTTTGTTSTGAPDYDADIAGIILSGNEFAERGKVSAVVVKRWAEAGILSRSDDLVGSQKAIVIQAIGEVPATPTGYKLAKTEVGEFEGFRTNNYTFLKAGEDTGTEPNIVREGVILSRSRDNVGSQLAVTLEVFDGVATDTMANAYGGGSGYLFAKEQESDVEGIPTRRYTFLKPSVLSESEDLVGSQGAITIEAFSETPSAPAGYALARTQESDVEGVPTRRYTFLQENVVLVESKDFVGSQLAITSEVFKPTDEGDGPKPAGYNLANRRASDVDGIPTIRFTYLKPSVLSETTQTQNNDKLTVVTIEAFNETPASPGADYIQITDTESDVEGIPTRRYVFAKGDGEVSRKVTKRNNGKLEVVDIVELKKGDSGYATEADPALAGYVLTDFDKREADGHYVVSAQFAKGEGEVSRRTTYRNNGKLELVDIVELKAGDTGYGAESEPALSGYTLISWDKREADGHYVVSSQFAKGEGEVSHKVTKRNNGKLELVDIVELKAGDLGYAAEAEPSLAGYVLTDFDKRESDGHYVVSAQFAKGEGEIKRRTRVGEGDIKFIGIHYLTGPTADVPTVDFDITTTVMSEESGYRLWVINGVNDDDYNGDALIDSETAQRDGAIVYVRSAWDVTPTAPTFPGVTLYNTAKKTKLVDGGKKTVVMTWVRPPADYSEQRSMNFKKPGWANVVDGWLELKPGVTSKYIATISHAFTVGLPGTPPTLYDIVNWATFRLNYTAADDGEKYFESKELPGYLGNSNWIGINSTWADEIDTTTGVAEVYSNPSSIPTGAQDIDYQSVVYLSDLSGTKIYRSTTTTITL